MGVVAAAVKSKALSGRMPINRVLYALSALQDFDLSAEKLKTRYRNLSIGSIFAGIMLSVAGSASNIDALMFAAVLPVVLFIVFIIFYLNYRSLDLSNEFRQYLIPILNFLKDDIRSGAPVQIHVELAPIEDKKYETRVGEKYAEGQYYHCVDHFFQRRLIMFSCRLADGNGFALSVVQRHVKSVRRKKTARGKIKFKNKYRGRFVVTAALTLDGDRFTCTEPQSSADVRYFVKKGKKGQIFGLKYVEKFKGEVVIPNPHVTLKRLVGIYGRIEAQSAA
jgi:hypothetical protein